MTKFSIRANAFLAAICVCVLAAASCAQDKDKDKGAGDESKKGSQQMAAADDTYVIGAQDVLNISVWHEPELSSLALPVRPDGKISMPLLDDIQAAGRTPLGLAQDITEKLKKFVTTPQVTVVVKEINSKRIYMVGSVSRAGAYPLLPNMTVLQALSSAGGLQQYANPKKIYVLRRGPDGSHKIPFNYKKEIRGQKIDQEIILQPGDTVVVP